MESVVPLKIYRNKETGEEIPSLKKLNLEEWDEVITAPNTKMMEVTNAATNTSRVKGLDKILTARARNYARDNDQVDQYRISELNGMTDSATKNLLAKDGTRRKKIDDI